VWPSVVSLAFILLCYLIDASPFGAAQKETRGLMRQIALGIVVTGLVATSAYAQQPTSTRLVLDGALAGISFATAPAQAPAVEEESPVSVLVGADMPSVYYFRGFRQESDAAFTFQPYVDVGVAGEAASLNVGIWNSLHTGSLKDADAGWYETDFYAAATVQNIKATYTAYTYPRFDDATIHELMLSTTFDHMLAPSVAVAFEFAKPEGLDKGIYLELGAAPALPLGDDAPISVTVPLKVGLSLKDYYGDDTFGYFSGGVTVGYPVSDAFEVHGGVTFYAFGYGLEAFNGEAGAAVASVGFSVGF
jgi:hypothetical protein